MIRSTGVPFAIAWPCARCVDAMTSSRVERGADAGRGRLLPDRDVQEPGQLAGAEALLDLLLEAADQEHLAEEAAQHLLGDAPTSGPGLLFDGRHRAAIMLIRRCEPPTSGRGSRRASPRTGPRRGSRSRPRDRRRDAAAVLAPLQPGRVGERAPVPRHARRTAAPSARGTSSGGSTASGSGARSRSLDVARRRARRAPPRRHAADRRASLVEQWDDAARHAPAGLERPAVRARARLERPPAPRGAPRRAAEPDAGAGCDSRSASASRASGLRRLAADGAPLLRAHGRGGHHRADRGRHGLSDTENDVTQGPVWRVAGRSV